MKICVAGQGAFGQKHLDALKRIDGVEVTSLVGGNQDSTAAVAKKYGVPHYTGDLSEGIKRADAVILTTPTKMHFRQGEQVMRAGKHVLVEIPVTDSVEDAEKLVKIAKETGVIAMGGHVRRFNPSHQYVHKKIEKGELKIQQMDVQTYFFRRKNINAAGNARSWTDHLLWHHAAHTIDLFQYQAGETISDCYAVQGPIHPQLNIAMDMGIVAKVPSGAILTLSLSFNNDGPLGSFFRYICDNGTYKAFYDDLSDGKDNKIDVSKVDVSMDGIELEDREFIAAIKEKREPNASLHRCCPACTCSASSSRSSTRSARRTRSRGLKFGVVPAQAGTHSHRSSKVFDARSPSRRSRRMRVTRSARGRTAQEEAIMPRTKPPFRADHVGSILRSAAIKEARARRESGRSATSTSRRSKTARSRRSSRSRRTSGLQLATDGEYRRSWWHLDFCWGLTGARKSAARSRHQVPWRRDQAGRLPDCRQARFSRRPPDARPLPVPESAHPVTPKMCIPAPPVLHFRLPKDGIPKDVYPDMDGFFARPRPDLQEGGEGVLRRRLPLSAVRRHGLGLSLLAGRDAGRARAHADGR